MGTLNLFDRLPLPWQSLVCGSAGALVMLALASIHGGQGSAWAASAGFPGQGTVLAWALAMAAVAVALAAWPARRAANLAEEITDAAHRLAADGAPEDAQLPYSGACRELHHATLALRRVVERSRRRRHLLELQNAALSAQLNSRTQELSSLQELSIGLARHGETGELVDEALRTLEQTMAYSSASVWAHAGLDAEQPVVLMGYHSPAARIDGEGPPDLRGLRMSRGDLQRYEQIEREGTAIVENQPRQSLLSWLWAVVADDARSTALYRGTRSWMALPLKVRDRVLGVLRVDHGEPGYFDAERMRLLAAVAGQTALALQHAHTLQLNRDAAVTRERNRIARELHDAVSQTLFAASLLASTLARNDRADDGTRQQARTLERLNRSALAEMRMMLFELRPEALENVRLAELLQQAVEALQGRSTVEVAFNFAAEPPLPAAQRIHVYRIAQEALSNVARHSGACHAQLSWLTPGPGRGVLRIADDGKGFDPQARQAGHFGLVHMQERAQALGARLKIDSAPGEGSELVLELNWS
jgi:signal transduction histidine kinase